MGVFKPSRQGLRMGVDRRGLAANLERPRRPIPRDYQPDDPAILQAARAARLSPFNLAHRATFLKNDLLSPRSLAQFDSWVDCQNRVRTRKGQPLMNDEEIEAAWSQVVAGIISRSVEVMTRTR